MTADDSPKPSVAFVGAFNTSGSAIRGGQISACHALLNSPLAGAYRFHLIDSTQESVPPPPLRRRAVRAGRRVAHFASRMLTRRDAIALIFISDGFGFLEKGVMVLLARLCGRRVVLAPRSGILVDDYQRGPLWRACIRTVLRAADVVVCQSAGWRETFAGWGVPRKRLAVIPNWIDARPFAAIEPPAAEPDRPLRVLFLGHVEAAKGIHDLIDALAALGDEARISLVVAGSGGALEPARQQAVERGVADRIRFAGWVDEAGRLAELAAADVLVLPSYREGLPNAVLEAMAAARPSIATRVGGIPDLVEHRVTGLLYDAGDVQALARCLLELSTHRELVTAMGGRARERALSRHSVAAGAGAMMRALSGR